MVATIISVCSGLISGTILFFIQRYFRMREKHEEQVEFRRERKDILMLKSLKAIGELTVASAVAVKDGKVNGEMHKAMDEFEEVDKELYDFLINNITQK